MKKTDKFYTLPRIAKYVIERTNEVITEDFGDKVGCYLEPSAGCGVFLDYFDKDYDAYDIEPNDHRIDRKNFFDVHKSYKGRHCVCIGNPPFSKSRDVLKFMNKAAALKCKYISFILPVSYFENETSTYRNFKLLYSENLGTLPFTVPGQDPSTVDVEVCFNIYKVLDTQRTRPKIQIKGVRCQLYRGRADNPAKLKNADIILQRLYIHGRAKLLSSDEASENATYFLFTFNDCPFKDEFTEFLRNYDFSQSVSGSLLSLTKAMLLNIIKLNHSEWVVTDYQSVNKYPSVNNKEKKGIEK